MSEDPEIAGAATEALKSKLSQVWQRIYPIVHDRSVTLEGTVAWNYERAQAESVVRQVRGIRALTDQIEAINDLVPARIKEQVEQAFRARAERTAALSAACATPGVSSVLDELVVREAARYSSAIFEASTHLT
jgi:BON domain